MPETSRRVVTTLAVMIAAFTTACFSYTPVSELAPPAGPSAEELAADMNVVTMLGVDDAQYWPDPGERAALVSCAVAFRPEDVDEVRSLNYLRHVDRVSNTDLERIVDTFCATFTREVYERVELEWMPESDVAPAVEHRSGDPREQLAMAYDGYGYFGGLPGITPALNRSLRTLARELDRNVFIGGITVRLAENGDLRFAHGDLTLQGWTPEDRTLLSGGDVSIGGPGRYQLDDYGSAGLELLAEALAIRFAHLVETQSSTWETN